MSETRIYCVSDGNTDRLVRATSRAQAVGHVARMVYKSRVATQSDLETLLPVTKVETAGEKAQISLPIGQADEE